MGMMDKFLGAMRLNVPYDEDLDEDEYTDTDDADEEEEPVKHSFFSRKKKNEEDDLFDSVEEEDAAPAKERPRRKTFRSSRDTSTMENERRDSSKYKVHMIVARSADELDEIVDLLIEGDAVVLNLEGVNTNDALRIIDFTGGACYTMGGRLQRISNKIFIATPHYIDLSGDFIEMINDSIDANSLNLSL